MKPYYERGGITIYHGDCLEILPHVQADVLVTDPPYGMAYQSNWGDDHDAIEGDQSTAARDDVLSAWGSRPAIVFGRWDQPRPAGVVARLIWSKAPDPMMGDLSFPWGNSDEEIYVMGFGFVCKRRVANVITMPTPPKNGRLHPTPKPVALMAHLIERCPAGTILDTFMGSGTTLRAAKDLGRKAIGIEIEEKYCEIAAKRLSQEVLPFGDA
jgi:DNA modification methylase